MVSVLALALNLSVPVLAVVMLVWGLGWTLNHAGLSTVLTDLPREVLNEAASLNSSVRFVSGGAGMALGGMLLKQDFDTGFLVFAAALGLLLVSSRYLVCRRA